MTAECNSLLPGSIGQVAYRERWEGTGGSPTPTYGGSARGGGQRRWNSYNHIGNVVGTSNASGYFVEAVNTDAFGNPLASTQTGEWAGGLGGNRGLTTKELDPAGGMYYFYQRWYDPQTATFASRAPYPPMMEHTYGLTENNPLLLTDPTGNHWMERACDAFRSGASKAKRGAGWLWAKGKAGAGRALNVGRAGLRRSPVGIAAGCIAGGLGGGGESVKGVREGQLSKRRATATAICECLAGGVGAAVVRISGWRSKIAQGTAGGGTRGALGLTDLLDKCEDFIDPECDDCSGGSTGPTASPPPPPTPPTRWGETWGNDVFDIVDRM